MTHDDRTAEEKQLHGDVIAELIAGMKRQDRQRESALAALIARGYEHAAEAAPDPQTTENDGGTA